MNATATTTATKLSVVFKTKEKYSPRKAVIEIELGAKAGQTENVITAEGLTTMSSEKVQLLSIMGDLYEWGSRDMAACGQIHNTFEEELAADNIDFAQSDLTREQLNQLLAIWKEWHCNNLTMGTPAQSAAVKEWEANSNKLDYTAACNMLAEKGLLVDASMANYKYGSAWLTRLLPAEVITFVESLKK
jgi:hypothetical protein